MPAAPQNQSARLRAPAGARCRCRSQRGAGYCPPRRYPPPPQREWVFSYLTGMGGRDMAVDLGTANTLVYAAAASSSPSRRLWRSTPARARCTRSGSSCSACSGAPRDDPGDPSLKDGVIADFDVTEQMLRHYPEGAPGTAGHTCAWWCACLRASPGWRSARSRRPASAGARQAYLIEEPMAAAIGAGLG